LSVQEVAAGDPSGLAYRLLEVLAVLSPAGVDRRVLRAVPLLAAGVPGRDSDHDEEPAAHNEQDAAVVVDEAVELLADTSLITLGVNGTQAAAHRLVQRVVRERAAGRHRLASVVGLAATAIESLLVDEHQAWKARDIAAHGIQQIDALWSLAGSLDLATMDSGLAEQLVEHRNWAVRHLRTVADLTRAITTGRTVLADAQRILGADHPDTLGSRNNLAYAYRLAGRVGEAIPLFEQTLADYGRVLGAGHPYTLTSRNNLAYAYQSAGRLGEAIPLFERTLADRERILGADHPDTLTSRNDLAGAYRSAKRPGEATPPDSH
jgi:tetratricopeptide (TPR) repeat protein